MEIRTKGFELLNEDEKSDFNALFENYSKKIERKMKGVSSIVVHLKDYSKKGLRKKFSVHAKIIYSGRVLEADAFDWDFKRTIHKIFRKIEEEIEHRFHISDKRKR